MHPDDPRQRWLVVSDNALPASAHADLHSFRWLDLFVAISRRRVLLLASILISTAIGLGVAYSRPDVYTATAQLLPPQQSQSALTALVGKLGDVASLAGARDFLRNPGAVYAVMLKSRSVADGLIDRFQLMNVYRVRLRSAAMASLARHTAIDVEKEGEIRLSVTDSDPKLAAAIANGYIDELSKLCDRLAITGAAQRRLFFDRQAAAAREHLALAEKDLQSLEERRRLIAPEQQLRLLVTSEAELRNRIASKRLQVEHLLVSQTAENPDVKQASHDLAAMEGQLREMTSVRPLNSVDAGVSEMPARGLDYLRKLRDVKYYETLLEALSRQLEAARLDESNQAVVLQTIDAAMAPDRKSGPHRLQLVLLSAGAGFSFCTGLISLHYLYSLRSQNLEDHTKWKLIQSALLDWGRSGKGMAA